MSKIADTLTGWDRTRAQLGRKDYALETEEIELATDFECGNGSHLRQVGSLHYALDGEAETGTDHPFGGKCSRFCFAVRNKHPVETEVTVDVCRYTHDLPQTKHISVWNTTDWWNLPVTAITLLPDEETVRIRLRLPPSDEERGTLFVCNFHWYPFTQMVKWMKEMVCAHPNRAQLKSIGKTALGFDIFVLTITEGETAREAKEAIIVSASPQCSEAGNLACQRVIEYLLSDESETARLRRSYKIHFIPYPNPDGTVLGTTMVNSLGQNPFFDAITAVSGRDGSLESKHAWEFASKVKPWLYLEYHSAFQDQRDSYIPFLFPPELLTDEKRRQISELCDQRICALSQTRADIVELGDYGTTLGYLMKARCGAISYFYKLHNRFPLEENLQRALEVFVLLERTYHQASAD